MTRSDSDGASARPLEEYWLLALMCLLLCAGLLFVGIVVVVNADEVAAIALAPETPTLPPGATQEPTPTLLPILEDTPTPAPEAPTETPTPTPVKIVGPYKVVAGDTLLGIALRAGLTLDQILAANLDIADPNRLRINQIINIPQPGKIPPALPPANAPAVVAARTTSVTYEQVGEPGGYVPLGAMSISAAHTVKGKYYPAGTLEYLHGLYKIPFPLPYIAKDTLSLPPPVPAGQCPLTGLPLANPALLNRRPLNVRIDNAPPARPQSGLGSADIIFETLAEGGITRFTAVFLCSAADADIGPIRSARLIDLQLEPMFKAILVHVGAAAPVTDMIWSSEVGEFDFDPVLRGTPGFGRIPSRPSPHNVYTSIGTLWSVAGSRGMVGPVDLQGLSFDANAPAGGVRANVVRVPYSAVSDVSYTYNDGRYTKLLGGAPHVDANTGQPIRLANVIALYAKATYTSVLEDGVTSRSLHFNVQGAGNALLVRDGLAYSITWYREGRNILFHFRDVHGNPIPLKPGPTIVNIVPLELRVTVE